MVFSALPLSPLQPVLAGLNHLLGQTGWARDRLQGHQGRKARFSAGSFDLNLRITTEGCFEAATDDGDPDVAISLPLDAPVRMMQGGVAEVMKGATVTGAADLADALGYVLRNLRWDMEEDLSRVVGDIAAHRLVKGAESLLAWQKDAATSLAENLSEYLVHENPQLVRQEEFKTFSDEVAALRAQLAGLEKRLNKLV